MRFLLIAVSEKQTGRVLHPLINNVTYNPSRNKCLDDLGKMAYAAPLIESSSINNIALRCQRVSYTSLIDGNDVNSIAFRGQSA